MSVDTPIDSARLLTTDEAAHYLSVTQQTLEAWRYNKTVNIPYVKIGRCVRYRREDLAAFIVGSLNSEEKKYV